MMTKKTFYKWLVSASLLGAAVAVPVLTSPVAYADGGTFVVGNSSINVRRSPSTSGEVVAQYSPGQAIDYDSIVEGDGYRWISYVGGSGSRNYVAIGTVDGSQTFGSLSGDSSSTISTFDFAPYAGEWVNGQGDSFTLTADGYFNGQKMSFYDRTTVVLFSVEGAGGGFVPVLIPKGTTSDYYSNSDASQDRFVIPSSTIGVSNTPLSADAFFYKETASQPTSETSETEEKKPATAKPWTGDNPYKKDLNQATTFDNTNDGEPVQLDYALYDLDGNGTPELIVGNKDYIQAVYTLVDDQPTLVTQLGIVGGVAGVGGYRGGITLYESGEIALLELSSGSGKGERKIYTLKADNSPLDQPKTEAYQMGQEAESVTDKLTKIETDKLTWLSPADQETTASETKPSETSKSSSSDSTSSSSATRTSSDEKTTQTESSPSSADKTTTAETSAKQASEGNPIQQVYQKITRRKTLPSTGEAVSVLGVVGLAILGFAAYIIKKLK